jgi:arylsulfatase A-like enzyme
MAGLPAAVALGVLVWVALGWIEVVGVAVAFPRQLLASHDLAELRFVKAAARELLWDPFFDHVRFFPPSPGGVIGFALHAAALHAVGGALSGAAAWAVSRVSRPGAAAGAVLKAAVGLWASLHLLAWNNRIFHVAPASRVNVALGVGVLAAVLLALRLLPRPHGGAGRALRRGLVGTLVVSVAAGGALSATRHYRPRVGDAQRDLPNLILLSIDTLRADHLSVYGYPRPTSPELDRLAREGFTFARCLSSSSWTLPSHVSLLTSLSPAVHGVLDDGSRLDPLRRTLAEMLSDAGYVTMAIVSLPYLRAGFGYAQGFDVYDDDSCMLDRASLVMGAARQSLEALAENQRRTGRPFFLFVHAHDPHSPYRPPAPFDRRFDPGYEGSADGGPATIERFGRPEPPSAQDLAHVVALYDGEIAYHDRALGTLRRTVEREGIAGSTLLAVTSDHGEEFRDHGSMFHGITLYEEQLHVPWILWGGPVPKPGVSAPMVRHVDVIPTLLDLLGVVDSSGEAMGRSLAGRVRGGEVPGEAPAFAHSTRSGPDRMAFESGGVKYLVTAPFSMWGHERGGEELYDLEVDPRERDNLWDRDPRSAGAAAALQARLGEMEAVRGAMPHSEGEGRAEDLPPSLRESLRALGYVQ